MSVRCENPVRMQVLVLVFLMKKPTSTSSLATSVCPRVIERDFVEQGGITIVVVELVLVEVVVGASVVEVVVGAEVLDVESVPELAGLLVQALSASPSATPDARAATGRHRLVSVSLASRPSLFVSIVVNLPSWGSSSAHVLV
jgi:hypothetical protein